MRTSALILSDIARQALQKLQDARASLAGESDRATKEAEATLELVASKEVQAAAAAHPALKERLPQIIAAAHSRLDKIAAARAAREDALDVLWNKLEKNIVNP